MNRQDVLKWIELLKNAWKNHNIENILLLFKDVTEYYEGPFSLPVSSQSELLKLWEEIVYQDIVSLDIDLIAIEDCNCAMHWYLKYKDMRDESVAEMDGTYEVHFNKSGMCIYFKQWWVMAY